MKALLTSFVVICASLTVFSVGHAHAEVSGQEAIREHLSTVEYFLRSADTSHLTAEQRKNRARNLDALREYWKRGDFPKNYDFPRDTPYFVDAHGTSCAMAYIITESGHPEVTRAVAERENNAYVMDMKSPELVGWIESSGLTLQEAAWIQPSYGPSCNCDCEIEPVHSVSLKTTYINPCAAIHCRGLEIEDLRTGCHEVGAQLEYPNRWDGSAGDYHCSSTSGGQPSPIASATEYCADESKQVDWGMELDIDPEDVAPDSAEEGCSAAAGGAPSDISLLALALGLVFWRRRRG